MNKPTSLLPLTFALLTACSGTPGPATLGTLTLGGVSGPLQISSPAKLSVTATDTGGNTYVAAPTFTSSDPNVISVTADGTLSVRHLSTAPVVLSVTVDGRSASLTATTYGLDVAGGTYQLAGAATPGSTFIAVFRDAAGHTVTSDTPFTVQGPGSFNAGNPVTSTLYAVGPTGYALSYDSKVPAISGTYTASLNVAGTAYSKTFSIDAAQLQPFAGGVSATVTSAGYTAQGTLPASGCAYLYVYTASAALGTSGCLKALPASGTWTPPLPVGAAYLGAFAASYSRTSGTPFPDQVNRSFSSLGSVNIR